MPDDENVQAAMYGPVVLAARLEEEAREKWYRHFAADEKKEPAPALKMTGKVDDPASWLEAAPGNATFRTKGQKQAATFVPLARIVHERYSVYHEVTKATSSKVRRKERAGNVLVQDGYWYKTPVWEPTSGHPAGASCPRIARRGDVVSSRVGEGSAFRSQ